MAEIAKFSVERLVPRNSRWNAARLTIRLTTDTLNAEIELYRAERHNSDLGNAFDDCWNKAQILEDAFNACFAAQSAETANSPVEAKR
jgi:hypothetical protein